MGLRYVHFSISCSVSHHQSHSQPEQSASLYRTIQQINKETSIGEGQENALLLTISMYSSSVGHLRESRHRISRPWPRWRERSSANVNKHILVDTKQKETTNRLLFVPVLCLILLDARFLLILFDDMWVYANSGNSQCWPTWRRWGCGCRLAQRK